MLRLQCASLICLLCGFRRFGRCLSFSRCSFSFSRLGIGRLRVRLFERLTGEGELAQNAFTFRIDLHALAIFKFAHQDLLRNGVFDVALNHTTQRTRAQQRVEALLREQILGSVSKLERHVAICFSSAET